MSDLSYNGFEEVKQLYPQFEKAVETALEEYGEELRRLVTKRISEMGLNYSGDMRKSIDKMIKGELRNWILKVGPTITDPPYPTFVHEGTKPHFLPREGEKQLKKWVRKKLGFSGKELEKITKAIKWKIAKKGTKAHPFLKLVFEQEKDKAADRIAKKINKRL